MDCSKAQRLVQEFADGRLTGGIARELQRHLADCTDCRVTQQRTSRLQQLLAVKRHEKPREGYFDGFLAEFHSRVSHELAPRPTLWEQFLGALRIQGLPAFRYGFAPAFGLLVAFGMILRGMVSTHLDNDNSRSRPLNLESPHLSASAWPAPHSTPRAIASLLPRSPERSSVSGALILPVAPRGEPASPRYVLDRISLSPSSYEVASIHF
jgi:hypothetical protein